MQWKTVLESAGQEKKNSGRVGFWIWITIPSSLLKNFFSESGSESKEKEPPSATRVAVVEETLAEPKDFEVYKSK